MSLSKTTEDVCSELGINYESLYRLIRRRLLAKPPRDSGGRFTWRPEDVRAARLAAAKQGLLPHLRPVPVTAG
jgi:hypothetical protein